VASGAATAVRVANRVGAVWLAVAGLFIVTGLISPAMFQVGQVLNILQVSSFLGVIAIGQTLALLTGGIDLSQAGVVTLVNIVAADVMNGADANIPAAVAVSVALSLAVGAANAVLVMRFGVTPLIATLGMNSILFGAALVFTGGAPHGAVAPGFQVIGTGALFGLPAPTLLWLAASVGVAWLSRRTVFGRNMYAAGANPRAALLMGVAVARTIGLAYVGSALLACAGGLLLTGYIGAPSLGIGTQFMLTSVAAVVIGGTALSGGVGSIIATAGGAIFVTELSSFTNIARISTGMQYVVQGVIIALSVLAYRAVSGRA
jgi:ribose/xylose/arabinose/galactoside ABC-type transport system permease subunit